MMLEQGQVLDERYEIDTLIGQGGMSYVYRANDRKMGRVVAIKVLKEEYCEDEDFIRKFQNEAQAAAKLNHPNIVAVYDIVDNPETKLHYIVMELVEGITLKNYIKRAGRMDSQETIAIALQAAAGIELAHKMGIVHRDIKPQNIIVDSEGNVKVADFGIARAATQQTVTAHAKKGVVLATGGYAANIAKVVETNEYWDPEYLNDKTETTNRSSLQGDGITMAEAVGAATTGMGYTQLMPISWVDNGDLAFGGGDYAVYINPTTGKRFVDETSERDVLSLGEFRNGIEWNGHKGVFIEIANAATPIPGPYPYKDEDVEGRQYVRTIGEIADVLKAEGFDTDVETIKATIEDYDQAIINGTQPQDVSKKQFSALIGDCEKNEDGSYKADTYNLDDAKLRIRFLAPSTHHTMGGIHVDVKRHVLDADEKPIAGLYAAGEVTGGIHGGNRLGGNAITEIFVSGRTAANAISEDN